ncbi:hypothetical protein [Methylomicrobium lacus]|uniref:hypothetical protein n=1 Tax=Methylomicrobium lacus TaxID=136992 RepID=UPI0004B47E0B|nr:hypothetical protein [Methylomicrobium lacus]
MLACYGTHFARCGRNGPFTIDAIVILPDHLHAIWTLPVGDTDYSGRWRAIKSCFTHRLRASGIPLSRDSRGEYSLWQQGVIHKAHNKQLSYCAA